MEFGSAFLGSYSEYHVKYGEIEHKNVLNF